MSNSQWPATGDSIEGVGDAPETTPGAFPVGDRLLVDGQVYDCTALTPCWSKRQAREINLATFSSLCPDCSARFEATVTSKCPRPLSRVRDRIPRRCPFCRAAGHRVNRVLHIPARHDSDAAAQSDFGSQGTAGAFILDEEALDRVLRGDT